jgi:hypothetical protein
MPDWQRLSFLANCLGLNRKQVVLIWEDIIKKDFKEMGTSWEVIKRVALNRLGWRRSMHICVGLRRLIAVLSF